MKRKTLKNKILEVGIENCLFLLPMRPLNSILGIKFTTSSDPEFKVPAEISEERYKVEDDYKITLKSTYEQFGKEHFYISDLENLIIQDVVKFFIKQ